MTYTVSGGALNSAQSNPKPYQGNELFLYIVCAIAVTIDRILWNMFTGYFLLCQNTVYDVFNSVIRWHPASIGYPASIRDPASIRSFMVSARVMTECWVWVLGVSSCRRQWQAESCVFNQSTVTIFLSSPAFCHTQWNTDITARKITSLYHSARKNLGFLWQKLLAL